MSVRHRGYFPVSNRGLGAYKLSGPTALWSVIPSAVAQVTIPEPSAIWVAAPLTPTAGGCCWCGGYQPVAVEFAGPAWKSRHAQIKREKAAAVVIKEGSEKIGTAATDVVQTGAADTSATASKAANALQAAWGKTVKTGNGVAATQSSAIPVSSTGASVSTPAAAANVVAPTGQALIPVATGATIGGLFFGPVGLVIGGLIGSAVKGNK